MSEKTSVKIHYNTANLIGVDDEILRHLAMKVTGATVTLLESGSGWVAFYANEDTPWVSKNQGYMLFYDFAKEEGNDVVLDVEYHEADSYSKIVRSHDDMKAELDRLWPFYDSYGQRRLFERLYAFLGEMPPKE